MIKIKQCLNAVSVYLRLIRAYVSPITSLPILVGFSSAHLAPTTVKELSALLLAYITFSLIFYGGIYIINDIKDLDVDRKHQNKKVGRVIAADEISVKNALIIALVNISLGLVLGGFISVEFLTIQVLVLALNLGYTFVFKNVIYLDILFNALTHPMRVIAGISLAGGNIYNYTSLILTFFFLQICSSAARRYREYIAGYILSRPVLQKYNLPKLQFIQYAFLIIMWIHLVITVNAAGLIFRLGYVVYITYIIISYRPKSPVKVVLDTFFYGKADEAELKELQDTIRKGKPIDL